MRHHREMIQYCYAGFVSWFDTSFEKCKSNTCLDIENELDEYTCDLEDDIPGLEEEDSGVLQENLSCEREIFEYLNSRTVTSTVMRKGETTPESHQISKRQLK